MKLCKKENREKSVRKNLGKILQNKILQKMKHEKEEGNSD